jgi:glutamate-ammonia-ligase adenylyltransferase
MSPSTQKIDSVSRRRLKRFIPKLIELTASSARPLLALTRTLDVTERVLRRSAYLALLNENQRALSKFVDLCARSQYIADQVAKYPILLDELLDPQSFSSGVSKDDLLQELRQTLAGNESADSEDRMQMIAQFQRAAMFRIAIADFSGTLPIMKVSDGLTWLAELILDETLKVVWRDLTRKHGKPCFEVQGITHEAGFGIVGYGKLGGLELSYGSDLDIVFLHDSKGEKQVTNGDKPLDNMVFFGRLVRRLVHFLTTQTGSGLLYEIDTRLRPDGHSGLLVTSTEAFERYQEENAWTWEHQALLRARAVAGSDKIAAEFERIRSETLASRVRRDQLREDVTNMRRRMRQELDKSDQTVFDLKHGHGGIGDIEFLVQYLVLREAGTHLEVSFYSDNIRQIDALITKGILPHDTGRRLQDIYRDYRLDVHRSVLDGRKAVTDAARFRAERDFVAATWKEWLE